MPKISVILTCYNSNKEYLNDCLNSILNQTVKDFEVLVVDDCSQDYLKKIIDGYIQKDRRVKYFRTPFNSGPAVARNLGFQNATGEYLAIMDHDDIVDLKRFEKQIEFLDKHPDIGVLGSAFKRFPNEKIFYPIVEDDDIVLSLLLNKNEFCQSSIMMRRSQINELNAIYQKEFVPAEDYAFFLNLIGKIKFHNLSDVLLYYRSHEANISKLNVEKVLLYSAQLRVKRLCQLFDISEEDFKNALIHLDLHQLNENDLKILEEHLPALVLKMEKRGYNRDKILFYYRNKYLFASRKIKKPSIVLKMFFSPLISFLKISRLKRYLLGMKYYLKAFFK